MTSKAHDVTLPQPDEVFRCLLREDVYNQAQASNIDRATTIASVYIVTCLDNLNYKLSLACHMQAGFKVKYAHLYLDALVERSAVVIMCPV